MSTTRAHLFVVYCSQWPRGLRRGSVASHLLGLRVRFPQLSWMFVSCECCVLSGTGLCFVLITRPEESNRVWCVWVVCVCVCVCVSDREASIMGKTWSTRFVATLKKIEYYKHHNYRLSSRDFLNSDRLWTNYCLLVLFLINTHF